MIGDQRRRTGSSSTLEACSRRCIIHTYFTLHRHQAGELWSRSEAVLGWGTRPQILTSPWLQRLQRRAGTVFGTTDVGLSVCDLYVRRNGFFTGTLPQIVLRPKSSSTVPLSDIAKVEYVKMPKLCFVLNSVACRPIYQNVLRRPISIAPLRIEG